MKISLTLLGGLALAAAAGAKEPTPKPRRTVPGPYPSIIKMAPAPAIDPKVRPGLIQSELGGREMQFLQLANQAANDQSTLIELARKQNTSEQIKAVAEALAATQSAEGREVGRIAAAKRVTLGTSRSKAIDDELSALAGAKFEKAWIERLMEVNESSADAYTLGAKSVDSEIRSFSEKMLPVAQARLQMANRLGGRSVAPKAGPPAGNPTAGPSAPPPANPTSSAPAKPPGPP